MEGQIEEEEAKKALEEKKKADAKAGISGGAGSVDVTDVPLSKKKGGAEDGEKKKKSKKHDDRE